MSDAPPSIWKAIRPLVFAGWAIAAIRLGLDATAPDLAWYFGVYWVMPVVLLVFALRKRFDGFGFLRLLAAMLIVAVLVWGLPNAVGYTTAQFMGWEHGRFAPERAPPLEESAVMRVGMSLLAATLTIIAGTIWMTGFAIVFVWLPGGRRRRKAAKAAKAAKA